MKCNAVNAMYYRSVRNTAHKSFDEDQQKVSHIFDTLLTSTKVTAIYSLH